MYKIDLELGNLKYTIKILQAEKDYLETLSED